VRAVFVAPARPGYLLLQLARSSFSPATRRALEAIRGLPGVLRIVGEGEVPMLFADSPAKAFLLGTGGELRKGDVASVLAGPFEGYTVKVEELLPDRGLVRVLVTIFGRQAPIELEEWQIGKAEEV
jgi:transcriptional antiterminator NusG